MLQGYKNKTVLLGQVLVVCTVVGITPVALAENHVESRNVEIVYQESQQFARSKKVAVLVGVGKYGIKSQLKSLKYPATDARMIEKVLKTRHDYTTRLLVDVEATKIDILDEIRQAGRLLPDNGQGTLVFFFSGHGFARGGKNYLATANLRPGMLQQSAISIDEVEAAIKQTKVRRAIILVDACRDDPWVDGSKGYGPSQFVRQRSEGVQHLFSAKFGEQSWESPRLSNGVFSHFLYRGLNGAAVERDGIISFDSLKRYVQDKVSTWTHQNLRTVQKPYHEGSAFGVFVLGQVGKHVKPTTPTTPATLSRQPKPVPIAQTTPRTVAPTPVSQAAPKPSQKQWFEPDMVPIPAGSFTMGCVPGRDNASAVCYDAEEPSHIINISAFEMAKTEVTFEQWDACTNAGVCIKADDDMEWGRGKRPVYNVSWNDAQVYLEWLSQQTGRRYQLPSEAQWEYAARANSNTKFHWGSSTTCSNASYGYDNCDNLSTKPVGSYPANAFGLHDMSGNLWEWVQDCYNDGYQGAPTSGVAWQPDDCDYRVHRGGSFSNNSDALRSASRSSSPRDLRNQEIGFRPVLIN